MPVSPTLFDNQDAMVLQWVGETGTSVSSPPVNEWPDKTVMATGTGTIAMQGSPDGTNWAPLSDQTGTDITVMAVNTVVVLLENPIFIRCIVTGGTATVTIAGND